MRFLHAIEHTLLREWLARFDIHASEGVVPPAGEIGSVDWRAAMEFDDEEWDEARLGVRPKASATFETEHALENAVARLCLEDAADDAPSSIHTSRIARRRRAGLRSAPMRSTHLLSIDWADDERCAHHYIAYYATWVPYYECTVVSASSFLPDPHLGYHDVALFAFTPSIDRLEGARRALLGEWARFEPRQARFVDFGVVDGPLARAWAERARSR